MLQTIRDKITGLVAIVFLGAIAIVFVFWGIDFQSAAGNYAAEVDGERIPAETVRRAWQQRQSQLQQMLRDELPESMVKEQQTALLDQFVEQALLTQRAKQYGYHVGDVTLARRVMEYPQFQVDGKFSKDRYNALLRSGGLTESRFEAELHNELLVDQLRQGLTESAFAVPYELDRRYALEKQEREIDYALISASEFAGSAAVTDEQIQKWYEEHKSNYLLPESVNLQYVELTRAKAEAGVSVTEQALQDYYAQIKERFTAPERRRARHVLITTGAGVSDEAARKQAEELTAKAKAGADFAQLAKDNSKDPGSAQQGGDLGWAERGMFVGPFEEALFSMSSGEIRGPIKTQFGYHVLKLEQVEAGQVRSFEQVRAELEAEYRRDRSQAIFYDEAQKLADLAFSSLTELDSVAKAMGLPVRALNGFTREGGGELGQDPGAIEAVFSEDVLERRQNSPLVTIGEDRALVLRVTDHKPAEPRPLAQVRAQIQEQLKTQAAREAATKKGTEAVARLQKGESWARVTAELRLTPAGKRFVTREDSVVPPAVTRAVFAVAGTEVAGEKPRYGGVTTDDGNYAVYAITQVRNGEPAREAAEQRNTRKQQVERQLASEEFSAYTAQAQRDAKIERNEKVFE